MAATVALQALGEVSGEEMRRADAQDKQHDQNVVHLVQNNRQQPHGINRQLNQGGKPTPVKSLQSLPKPEWTMSCRLYCILGHVGQVLFFHSDNQ